MAKYDSSILFEFADRLYSRANTAVAIYTVLGVLIGLVGGSAVKAGIGAIVGALIVGAIGFLFGRERAFAYKLQAQTALCQAKIEENTRRQV